MSGFKTDLDIRLDEDGLWVLLAPLCWEGSDGDAVTVPKGARTDFASVPQVFQFLLPTAATYVVRAAVVHDELCNLLGRRYHARREIWNTDPDVLWEETDERVPRAPFGPIDTDAVFEKIMRDEGANWLTQQIAWLGVRCGALANPARRAGWLSTAPRVLGLTTAFLAVTLATLALVAKVVPW